MAPTPNSIADLIALQSRRTPDAPAILAPGRAPLAFAALTAAIDATIGRFAAAGCGRGSRVALALPDGPEMAVALLAAISGVTCVPLNPALDEAAYRAALQALRVDALVVPAGADTAAVRAAIALRVPLLRLAWSPRDPAGTFELAADAPRAAVPRTASAPDDVALVLQTSGTTAAPKAVPLTQRNLVAPALTRARHLQLTAADRCLCVVPLYNSGMRRCLFPVLVAGGSIVCTPGLGGASFVDWLAEFEPTFYIGVPALQRAVLDEVARRGGVARSSLRFVLSGGAALPASVASRLEAALGVPVVPTYAMSEAGAIAQPPLPPARRVAGSVGLPAGNEFAIRGDAGEWLPPGSAGEIVVRGPEVFAGYENNREANARAFVDGWFRTGDLGYVDGDGHLFIVGRVNELINRGGHKISPSAVEAALLRHPEVVDAAAFAVKHATLGEDVIAAVVVRAPAAVTAQALRDYAFGNLPAFMVPTQVVPVAEIPRSPAGKVQRAELPLLLERSLHPDFAPPRDAHEALVASVFAGVLGVDDVGAFHNFFELGGDSLRGAQVVARLNAAVAADLDVVSLFQRPTVAEFAAEIARVSSAATSGASAASRAGPPAPTPRTPSAPPAHPPAGRRE